MTPTVSHLVNNGAWDIFRSDQRSLKKKTKTILFRYFVFPIFPHDFRENEKDLIHHHSQAFINVYTNMWESEIRQWHTSRKTAKEKFRNAKGQRYHRHTFVTTNKYTTYMLLMIHSINNDFLWCLLLSIEKCIPR